jgi:hypothetical protein
MSEEKVKVVFNACHGGYRLSAEACNMLAALKGSPTDYWDDTPRHDMNLVLVVETLGKKASGDYAKLEICEIIGRSYMIDEYDGFESVVTPEDIARRWINV